MLNRIIPSGIAAPIQNPLERTIARPSSSISNLGISIRGKTSRSCSTHWRRKITTKQKQAKYTVRIRLNSQNSGPPQTSNGRACPLGNPS